MNLSNVIETLKAEKVRIEKALALFEGLETNPTPDNWQPSRNCQRSGRSMMLEVLQQDIDKANEARKNPDWDVLRDCVVAQALLRQTGNVWEVGCQFAWYGGQTWETKAERYIDNWAKTGNAQPAVFEMRERV